MSNKESSAAFDSEEGTSEFLRFLSEELDLLDKARERCLKEKGELWDVLNPLIFTMVDSLRSVTWLAESYKVRDCFVLSRVVVETSINLCFICAEGETAARRAMSHARQKSYRDLERKSEINGQTIDISWSGKSSQVIDPDLQKDIDDFTHKNGRENTSWTPETVNQKLEIISKKYGAKKSGSLQWAFFTIYRHASEIAHGTYFGSIYIFGRTLPSSKVETQEDLLKHLRGHLNMLCLMMGGAISATLEILATELSDLGKIAKDADQAIYALKFPGVKLVPEEPKEI
jgi:hypothetical protein